MTETDATGLERSLMDPDVQSCPWSFYRELHATCPVHRMPETGFYLVTTWEDCRDVLADPATFSSQSNISKGLQAELSERRRRALAERGWSHRSTLHRTDPPEHTRYRRMVNRVFSPRRVRELVPHIEDVVHQLIDALRGPRRVRVLQGVRPPAARHGHRRAARSRSEPDRHLQALG